VRRRISEREERTGLEGDLVVVASKLDPLDKEVSQVFTTEGKTTEGFAHHSSSKKSAA
jgi:hypothetical protein